MPCGCGVVGSIRWALEEGEAVESCHQNSLWKQLRKNRCSLLMK